MPHRLFQGNCLEVMPKIGSFDCVFTDIPDNIGRKYNEYDDNKPTEEYLALMDQFLRQAVKMAPVVWVSFNSKWTLEIGEIFLSVRREFSLEFKPNVQTFTFGVQQQVDLKNCHRPLYRLMVPKTPLYPDQAREASWRLLNGDKRADPRGCVPGDWHNAEVDMDTVFNIPRVTGNSKQKRQWHDNQLHEDLVARCLKLTTKEGGSVCDPFGGTGTTLRVCEKLKRIATLVELDGTYCREIAKENDLKISKIAS